MKKSKLYFKSLYSTQAIFQLRKTKLLKSMLVLIFYTTFLNFGLVTSFINMTSIDPTLLSRNIYMEWENEIPNCKVNPDLQLICDSKDEFMQEFDNFNLIINPIKDEYSLNKKTNIIFSQDKIEITKQNERIYNLNYQQFAGVDFNTYQQLTTKTVVDDLSSRLFLSVKPYIIFPLLLSIYIVVILFNFLFVFGLASVGMVFNFSHNKKLRYKEYVNLIIFSSFIPSLLTFFVSVVISPIFGVVIYNFSLALLFLYVYKNEIKGNLS